MPSKKIVGTEGKIGRKGKSGVGKVETRCQCGIAFLFKADLGRAFTY